MKQTKDIINPKMLNEMQCAKCKYLWFAKKKEPRQCPNCKRQIKYDNK